MFPHQFCLFIQNNILFQLFLYIIRLKYALKKLHRKKIVNTSKYASGLKHIHSTVHFIRGTDKFKDNNCC